MSHEPVVLDDSSILVVDDVAANLDLLAKLLDSEPYRVSFATSGKQALKIAALDLPDIILLDVSMPEMDGFETCRRLKSMNDTRHIPVIFITGKTAAEDIALGFEVGGVDYINKPVRREELLARIRTQLQLQKLLQQRDELISQLRQHNAEQLRSLAAQEQEIIQGRRLSTLGEMVGEFAHEINTPIANTLTAISFLQENSVKIDTAFQQNQLTKTDCQQFLAKIAEVLAICLPNLNHSIALIESFKHVAVGQCQHEVAEFDLKLALERVMLSLQPKLKQQHHQVELICPSDLQVKTIAGVLFQIITNLTTNAIVHAFEEQEHGLIKIEVSQENEQVKLCFEDNGKGIAPEDIKRVFDKYFTTKSSRGGSGIGLNLVLNLVRTVLKGDIEVESEVGKGTCFTLRFPQVLAT